jgi:hypothetical protein
MRPGLGLPEDTVRLHSTRLVAPLTLAALAATAACRDSARDPTTNDSLQRDLELAQASTVSLASARDLPQTRFVSALESGERATAGAGAAARPAHKSPTKAPHAKAKHAPPTPAPVTAAVGAAAAAEETAPAPAPTSTTVAADNGPTAAPEATSGPSTDGVISVSPTDAPSSGSGTGTAQRGRGHGLGGIFGGIIGVVIRGGMIGDDDHCERDHPGRRSVPTSGIPYPSGVPFPIGRSVPGGLPMRFPNGGMINVPTRGGVVRMAHIR